MMSSDERTYADWVKLDLGIFIIGRMNDALDSEMYKVDNNLTREEKREFIIFKAGKNHDRLLD